jgi:hypothetical protein|uniref:hypothetical protein n=2 Tax=Cephaloticoccus sp. TaxID=1985742 RepID=UPI00404A8757
MMGNTKPIFGPALFYPHARLLVPVILLVNGNYAAADNDFVSSVGQITHYHEFYTASIDFVHHPENRGLLRRLFRLRVSTERLRHIVRATMLPDKPRTESDRGTDFPIS